MLFCGCPGKIQERARNFLGRISSEVRIIELDFLVLGTWGFQYFHYNVQDLFSKERLHSAKEIVAFMPLNWSMK